jgi:fumarate reductase subunit C
MSAGTQYSAFIAAQLTEERSTKTSLESRGITVITTSGALVTLLFGLVALATKQAATYTLPDVATYLLVVAALLMTLAAVFGLLTNWALTYVEVTPEGIQDLVDNRDWSAGDEQGMVDVAVTTKVIIEAARVQNGRKAILLRLAMIAEITGVFFVALAAVNVLTT